MVHKCLTSINGVRIPAAYMDIKDDIENLEIYDDDVWICTFPKSGTTWMQGMVCSIMDDLDFEREKIPLWTRSPWLESQIIMKTGEDRPANVDDVLWWNLTNSLDVVKSMQRPRFIKTHLPMHLLPRQIRTGEKRPKLVYVARNPKDACTSYFHSHTWRNYEASFDEFCTDYMGDKVLFGPYWNHVLGFWNQRRDENVLFLRFENMKADLPSVVRATATFLGKKFSSAQVQTLADHLSFTNMRNNSALNNQYIVDLFAAIYRREDKNDKFLRSGEIGQWKTAMTSHMIEKFDNWSDKNVKGTDYVL